MAPQDPHAKPTPEAITIEVPAGTALMVRLQNTISSASARSGESFEAVVDDPVVVDGQTVVPRGAAVVGKVTMARHSGRLHHPGELGLTLVSVDVGGKALPLETSRVYAKGASHKKRNLAWIGGSTGAGALIGGIASGGTGALIGSAIGAGGGTAAAFGTGKKDVTFGAERRMAFKLAQPIVIKG